MRWCAYLHAKPQKKQYHDSDVETYDVQLMLVKLNQAVLNKQSKEPNASRWKFYNIQSALNTATENV